MDALLAEQPAVDVDRKFADCRERLRKACTVKPLDPPRGFVGTLREYQRTGLGWLHFLRDVGLGGCLADDMGLGKTIQVLALLESRRTRRVPAGEVQFLYALRDEGTGREFQSQPILNTAGLGTANGNRPFRYFATPITFAPRSMIRMDVTEKASFKGELHVVLHGYRILGETGTPTAVARTIGRQTRRVRRR